MNNNTSQPEYTPEQLAHELLKDIAKKFGLARSAFEPYKPIMLERCRNQDVVPLLIQRRFERDYISKGSLVPLTSSAPTSHPQSPKEETAPIEDSAKEETAPVEDSPTTEPVQPKRKRGRPEGTFGKHKPKAPCPRHEYNCNSDEAVVAAIYDKLWRRYEHAGKVVRLRASEILDGITLNGEGFLDRPSSPLYAILRNRVAGLKSERYKSGSPVYFWLDEEHVKRAGWWWHGKSEGELSARLWGERELSRLECCKVCLKALQKRLHKGMSVSDALKPATK